MAASIVGGLLKASDVVPLRLQRNEPSMTLRDVGGCFQERSTEHDTATREERKDAASAKEAAE